MAILNIPITNVQPLNTLLTGISQLGYSGNAGLFLKVNATEDGFEFSAAGSSGVSIGDTIGSGTSGSVLFLGAAGVLEQSPTRLSYSDTDGLTINPSGTIINGYTAGLNIKGADPTLRITSGLNGFGEFMSGQILYRNYTFDNWASVSYGSSIRDYHHYFGGSAAPSIAVVHVAAVSATDTVIIAQGTTSQTGNLYENRLVGGSSGVSGWDANGNLFSNTGSGIQLATAATQKIGLWGATPVTRAEAMATSISYSSIGGTSVRANDTWGGYTILTAIATLKGLGILP